MFASSCFDERGLAKKKKNLRKACSKNNFCKAMVFLSQTAPAGKLRLISSELQNDRLVRPVRFPEKQNGQKGWNDIGPLGSATS